MVEVAKTMADAIESWRFVYQRYAETGLIKENRLGIHVMPMAIHPDTIIIIHPECTATMFWWRTPVECEFREDVADLRKAGRVVVEVGSLASTSLTAIMKVFKHAYHYAIQLGATDILCESEDSQRRQYGRLFGFEPFTERRSCPFAGGADATGLRLDLANPDMSKRGIKLFWKEPIPEVPTDRLRLDWKSIIGTVASEYFIDGISFCSDCTDRSRCFYQE